MESHYRPLSTLHMAEKNLGVRVVPSQKQYTKTKGGGLMTVSGRGKEDNLMLLLMFNPLTQA